jgi:hypothetical protein
MARPAPSDSNPFFNRYIDLVPENDIILALENQERSLSHFLDNIPSSKAGYAYAPGKWTVTQVLQHVMDAERIFAYRALCFARGESQHLPGFDENSYANEAPASHRTMLDITEEIFTLRKSTRWLFKGFPEDCLQRPGIASGLPMTVLSLGYVIVGHLQHHINILQERYL